MVLENVMVFYIDFEKCTGCKACMVACAVEHSAAKNLFLSISEKPTPQPRISVEAAAGYSLPLPCMHCENAPCIEACPTSAIYKTQEGLVLIREEHCIGCKLCMLACPLGAFRLNRTKGVVFKCDLCVDRLEKGFVPSCVESCSVRTGAIKYGYLRDLMRDVRGKRAVDIVSGRRIPVEKGVVVFREVEKSGQSEVSGAEGV